MINENDKPLYLVGDGGHARSLRSIASASYPDIFNITLSGDLNENDFFERVDPDQVVIANGIGVQGANLDGRRVAYLRYKSKGFYFANIVASTAKNHSVLTGQGIQLFEATYLGPNAKIQDNVVINTGSIVEHDCAIGFSSFIGPGAVLCGGVFIGDNVFVGAGAVILPDVKVPSNSVVPAGTRLPLLEPRSHRL